MKKIIFLTITIVALFNACNPPIEETGSIIGLVSDELEHELQRTKITLTDTLGKREVTETGTDGRYEFLDLSYGMRYTIIAALSGYYSDTITTTVNKIGVRGDFVLREIALRLSKTTIDVSTVDYADFVIYNDSKRELVYTIDKNANWLTLSKTSGTINAKSAEPIHVSINRDQVPEGVYEAKVVVNSSHEYVELTLQLEEEYNNSYVILQSDGLMVQKYDLSSGATWSNAITICQNSNVGGYTDWRLPTIGELKALYDNRELIGNFATTGINTCYWSSTVDGSGNVCYLSFISGSQHHVYSKLDPYRVRAVRTLP